MPIKKFPTRKGILRALATQPLTAYALARRLGRSKGAIHSMLLLLRREGKVISIPRKGRPGKLYTLKRRESEG